MKKGFIEGSRQKSESVLIHTFVCLHLPYAQGVDSSESECVMQLKFSHNIMRSHKITFSTATDSENIANPKRFDMVESNTS